ncbi:ScyD/ScyE family protein [Aphanothece hegewaldii CCALA 016]|uniref:ScyD/ScyE family protein n=1 Tax=Aphanothece hegewaldii CCALA 016 TaxID=2107694 RepID=A0A2T1M2Y8_9CHRO|nr:ScyD/ScyE family protein [Aphanothece hegewaldii]PSF39037.1 ScyD/ScyE family protein [Aphanothece hegewaldii CCALA 016]
MFKTILGLSLATLAISSQSALASNFVPTVLQTGLQSPRGMTFGPDGKLYLTEAGTGGNGACVPSPSAPGQTLCYGATSSLARLDLQSNTLERITTGLPSLALADGGDATGLQDVSFDANGNLYGVIGFASNPSNRDTVIEVQDFAHLIKIDLSNPSQWSLVTDIAQYEIDNNPDGGDVVSNPFSVAVQGNNIYATDGGGNALYTINNDGTISTVTVVPKRDVSNPIPGLPDPFPMQAVPTGIAIGPDQAVYLSEYTGFPFPPGGANIYRYNQGNLDIYASGFTNIIDIAFAPDNSLYVLEYATDTLGGNSQGNLWKVKPDGTKENVYNQDLINPTGLAISPDGKIYIANKGYIAGEGELIQLQSVPEKQTPLGVLLTTSLCVFLLKKQNKQINP